MVITLSLVICLAIKTTVVSSLLLLAKKEKNVEREKFFDFVLVTLSLGISLALRQVLLSVGGVNSPRNGVDVMWF